MSIQPSEAEIKSLYTFFINKNFYEAEKLSLIFTKKYPKFQFGWKVLGALYLQKGLFENALNANFRSLELANKDHEAAYNLAINFQNLNKLKKAYEYYSLAIKINPNYPEAFNNLGIINVYQNNLDDAYLNYTHAIKLKPNFAEAYNNLGNCLKKQNKYQDAIINYKQAINFQPNYQVAYLNWLVLIEQEKLFTISDENLKIIDNLLNFKNLIRPSYISKLVTTIISNKINTKKILNNYSKKNINLQELLSIISKTPLLLKFMSLYPLTDIELEKFLSFIRREILFQIYDLSFNEDIKNFQIALSNQLYINEFIYYENYDEKIKIFELILKLKDKIRNKLKPSIIEILCLSSYKPLNTLDWFSELFYKNELYEIYKRQIIDYDTEIKIKSKILSIGSTTDNISSKVKEQYEESPYPRWLSLSIPTSPKLFPIYLNDKKLNILNDKIFKIHKPKILIAGCGTGQHSIEISQTIANCEILAIDLSLNSLSYAKRKSQELNINNIEYVQSDILNLNKFNKQFDMIDCVGVLHHMDYPIKGWQCLLDSLKHEGIIRIGLYSEIGRKDIIKIKEEINKLNIDCNLDEMVSFRDNIIKSDEKHHQSLLSMNDFYSASEFRDLLFNIQEHRFSLKQIKDILGTLGLNFCGFENQKIINQFNKMHFNKNDLYNLDLWDQLEQSENNLFSEMYVFWCQKK